jgi:hypothetical protein
MSEENEALARRSWELVSQHNPDALEEVYAADQRTILHGAPITSIGRVPIGTILRSDVGTRIAGLLLPGDKSKGGGS